MANGELHISDRECSRNSFHFALIRRRVVRRDSNVERQRLITLRAHFDPMRAGFEVQPLEDPVEVVDRADEEAIDEHFGMARFDLQTQRPLVVVGGLRIGWVAAVPRIIAPAVVANVAGSVPPRVVVAAVVPAGNDDPAATAAGRGYGAARDGCADGFPSIPWTRVGRNATAGAVRYRVLCPTRAVAAAHGAIAGAGAAHGSAVGRAVPR